jgi:lipopolysaccharide export system protein LptA
MCNRTNKLVQFARAGITMIKICILCLAVIGVFFLSSASAAPVPAHKERPRLPITVKSNEMNADNKARTATFLGKVVAKQGDLTIFSDKLVVNYAEKSGDVDKVEAYGNVRIVQLNKTGFSDQAVYETGAGRIVLTGSPRVVQGGDSITGKVITYFVDDDKSDVSSAGDPKARVEAIINPPARKTDAGSR